MIDISIRLFLVLFLSLPLVQTYAEQADTNQPQLTTINLKYITGSEVLSVLKSLVDQSVSITEKDNVLFINGAADKTKNIVQIIKKIDTPAVPLTIQFIASNRKLDFNNTGTTYQTGRNKASQSMSITERQWVTLNTGLSIPITERKRYADGTEVQSFHYKKISKQYVFKVHEFSGWSVIQVGLNSSSVSEDVAGAIAHTKLNTTIIGKTGEWLEVTSSNPVIHEQSGQTYSTNRSHSADIFLYVKVLKNKAPSETLINNKKQTEDIK